MRWFLASFALSLFPSVALAAASDFTFAQLRVKPPVRRDALARLAWEVRQRTSIETESTPVEVKPLDPKLFRYPAIFWTGEDEQPKFSEAELRRLRRYLTFGGTLIIDASDGRPGGPFDKSVRAALERLLPRTPMARIPDQHVLFKTFYLVQSPAGRVQRVPYLQGIELDGRYAVIYSMNDLSGAWSRDAFGRWTYPVTPGGPRQREMAFRLGINIVMYVLCLDYKDDLVHAPFLLERRR